MTQLYTNATYPNGVEEGMVPPDGNTIATGDDTHFYKAYAMTNLGGGQFSYVLNATNCGAYRLTARFPGRGQHELDLVRPARPLHRRHPPSARAI